MTAIERVERRILSKCRRVKYEGSFFGPSYQAPDSISLDDYLHDDIEEYQRLKKKGRAK
jgi:hypothetical protein